MDTSQEVELHKNQGYDDDFDHDHSTSNSHEVEELSSSSTTTKTIRRSHTHAWWFRITIYAISLVAGQSSATLLGRFYYDKGGNSKWIATLVQSAGFPFLIPLFFFPSSSYKTPPPGPTTTSLSPKGNHPLSLRVGFLYLFFGVLLAGDNMMYSYGLLFLPVSTYSLLCATQLAFNAVFSFFFNAQRFTALVLNSLVVVTVSAALLAVHSGDTTTSRVSTGKYVAGFLCTVGASAAYSLYLSLLELSFKRVIKRETFRAVLETQVYPSFVATCCCVIGLFASGEWRSLKGEMEGYAKGKVSYVMTLVWTALCWQICSVGLLGLTFEVSSLFSNVISTLALPSVPVLGVILFGDKMDGVKVIALVLAVWGFLSYVYQQYLDESKPRRKVSTVV